MSPRLAPATRNRRSLSRLSTLSCGACLAAPRLGRGDSCSRADERLLDDRQIDNGGNDPERHTKPPDDVIGASPCEQQSAEINPEEASDLVTEERDAEQHREPSRSEHQ